MKWRGRRQSTNVQDLTVIAASIHVTWTEGQNDSQKISLIIDTDGSVYQFYSLTSGLIRIGLIPAQQKPKADVSNNDNSNWFPYMTSGQKLALYDVIDKILSYTDRSKIEIYPPVTEEEIDLVLFVQSVVNNK